MACNTQPKGGVLLKSHLCAKVHCHANLVSNCRAPSPQVHLQLKDKSGAHVRCQNYGPSLLVLVVLIVAFEKMT